MKIVWSEHCGECGKPVERHKVAGFASQQNHEFVRVPLNFNEWRKKLAEKLNDEENKCWNEAIGEFELYGSVLEVYEALLEGLEESK